jgi:NAD(P)-dependent dehydrogenase (short-subunit alcohol dehydrogenase family)
MKGKTVIVTGAGSGVGLETADALARKGASLILIELNRGRGEAAVVRIEQSGPKPRLFIADLSLQAEVRRVASEILASTPRIDVLINNAGAWFNERTVTAEGLECTFALNHLGYFLLTNLLLERIKVSAPARIISVASDGHAEAILDFDDLQCEKNYSGRMAYCRSKLANILFTLALARRLNGCGVTANCLHPGRVLSNFFENVMPLSSHEERTSALKGHGYVPTVDGSRTPIYLASSDEVEGITGEYFDNCQVIEPSKAAQDDIAAERLWTESLRLTGSSKR